jgi:hypothetical protein
VTFIHSLPDGIQADPVTATLRTRRDRPGDFFVRKVGEVMVLPEVGEFFGVVGAG